MTKKVTAFLTAILCMASVASMPASAYVDWTAQLSEDENGYLTISCERGIKGLYVKTDGTALDKEMVSEFGTIGGMCTLAEKLESESGIEYLTTTGLETLDTDGYILDVSCDMPDEDIMSLGRKLLTQVGFVEDVQVLYYELQDHANTVPMYFTTATVSEDTVVDLNEIPELSAYFQYDDCPNDNTGTLEPVNDLFAEKYYAETKQDPYQYTYYDSYMYLVEFGNSIVEKYSDVFTKVRPVVLSGYEVVTVDYTTSIWQDAGDNNSDGNVTAEDAAGMLTLAAQIGTGADIKATSANDVNADGTVNAEDAAAVLAYAAANGSGNEVSWVDILRR